MCHFVDCNTNYRYSGLDTRPDMEISEEMVLKQLNESVESGLVADRERGIFIREGYGALVGICPENCTTLDDVLKFTSNDFNRGVIGKPTIKEKLKEVITGNHLLKDPYFSYQKLVDEGYDLVLGPGCMVYGQQWNKAIYCRNYEEILENNKVNEIKR